MKQAFLAAAAVLAGAATASLEPQVFDVDNVLSRELGASEAIINLFLGAVEFTIPVVVQGAEFGVTCGSFKVGSLDFLHGELEGSSVEIGVVAEDVSYVCSSVLFQSAGGNISVPDASVALNFTLTSPELGFVVPTGIETPSVQDCIAGVQLNLPFDISPQASNEVVLCSKTFGDPGFLALFDVIANNVLVQMAGVRAPSPPSLAAAAGAAEARVEIPDGFSKLDVRNLGELGEEILENMLGTSFLAELIPVVQKVIAFIQDENNQLPKDLGKILPDITSILRILSGDDTYIIDVNAVFPLVGIVTNALNNGPLGLNGTLVLIIDVLEAGLIELLPEPFQEVLLPLGLEDILTQILGLVSGLGGGIGGVLGGGGGGLTVGALAGIIEGILGSENQFSEAVLFLLDKVDPNATIGDLGDELRGLNLQQTVATASQEGVTLVLLVLGPMLSGEILPPQATLFDVGQVLGAMISGLIQDFTTLTTVGITITFPDQLPLHWTLIVKYINGILPSVGVTDQQILGLLGAIIQTNSLALIAQSFPITLVPGVLEFQLNSVTLLTSLDVQFPQLLPVTLASFPLPAFGVDFKFGVDFVNPAQPQNTNLALEVDFDFNSQDALTFAINDAGFKEFGWNNADDLFTLFPVAVDFLRCGAGSLALGRIGSLTTSDISLAAESPIFDGFLQDVISFGLDAYGVAVPTIAEGLFLGTLQDTLKQVFDGSAACAAHPLLDDNGDGDGDGDNDDDGDDIPLEVAVPAGLAVVALVGFSMFSIFGGASAAVVGAGAAGAAAAGGAAGGSAAAASEAKEVSAAPTPEEAKIAAEV